MTKAPKGAALQRRARHCVAVPVPCALRDGLRVTVRAAAAALLLAGGGAGALAAEDAFDAPDRLFRDGRAMAGDRGAVAILGGVGTGFIGLGSDGLLREIGVGAGEPAPGAGGWLELEVGDGAATRRIALASGDLSGVRGAPAGVRATRLRGLFPRAFLAVDDPSLPLAVAIEAFAPLVPHDLARSQIPGIGFRVRLENLTSAAVRAGLAVQLLPEPFAGIDTEVLGDVGSVEIAPGAERILNLALGWHRAGPAYGAAFTSARAAAELLARDFEDLRGRTRAWQERIHRAELPLWYADRLINDLSTLATGTHHRADGLYGTTEAGRGLGRILGTIDQRLLSHVAELTWFPELEKIALQTFAAQQREDGAIQHHYGRLPAGLEPGAGFLGWPDLAASFVCQVVLLWKWTGDSEFAAAMAPHVERALAWLIAADADGDGIADGGSTFDDAHRGNGLAYVASVTLAAFRAAPELPGLGAAGREAAALGFERTRAALVDRLWNGRYFSNFVDAGTAEASSDCFIGQLAGEWYSGLLGLGSLAPDDLVEGALTAMEALNGAASPFIPPLEVAADGRIRRTPYGWLPHAQVYYGALLIQRGRTDSAWRCLEALDRVRQAAPDPFKGLLYYDALTGRPLKEGYEWYMSTPATWFTLLALLGTSIDVPAGALALCPSPAAAARRQSGPVFLPRLTGFASLRDAEFGLRRELALEVAEIHGGPALAVRELVVRPPAAGGRPLAVAVEVDGASVPCEVVAAGRDLRAVLAREVELRTGSRVAAVITEPGIERAADEQRRRVAERTVTLENAHLRATFTCGTAGFDRVTLTERAGEATAVLEAPHPLRLRGVLAGGERVDWTTDTRMSRQVRVIGAEHGAIDTKDGRACLLTLALEVREGRAREPRFRVRAFVRVRLAEDRPATLWSCALEGIEAAALRGVLEFPSALLADPGRIGEPAVLCRGEGVLVVPGDPFTSEAWQSAWRTSWQPGFVLRGPEAEFVAAGSVASGRLAFRTEGTLGGSLRAAALHQVELRSGAIAPAAEVEIGWRRVR